MSEIKQVIVVRTKYPDGKNGTKGLRAGKLIAQACHASMAFITKQLKHSIERDKESIKPAVYKEDNIFRVILGESEIEWLDDNFAKVCLQVKSEEELMEIAAKAESVGIECNVITDSGLTEFKGVPTKTCLALGPDYSERIDEITGHLELY